MAFVFVRDGRLQSRDAGRPHHGLREGVLGHGAEALLEDEDEGDALFFAELRERGGVGGSRKGLARAPQLREDDQLRGFHVVRLLEPRGDHVHRLHQIRRVVRLVAQKKDASLHVAHPPPHRRPHVLHAVLDRHVARVAVVALAVLSHVLLRLFEGGRRFLLQRRSSLPVFHNHHVVVVVAVAEIDDVSFDRRLRFLHRRLRFFHWRLRRVRRSEEGVHGFDDGQQNLRPAHLLRQRDEVCAVHGAPRRRLVFPAARQQTDVRRPLRDAGLGREPSVEGLRHDVALRRSDRPKRSEHLPTRLVEHQQHGPGAHVLAHRRQAPG
mmetsp:Transcript_3595/g.11047  ORF Transcript_3595/g.11047 Transcript_3595/m.11047 type:complete len:323 (-) Transcript_3595:469-1437(-)